MPDFWDNTPDLDLPQHVSRRREQVPPADESGVPVVYYVKVKCPKCGSDDCPVYCSEIPVRHHKCRVCGLNFKSIEQK